ncbi:unnamed protein product [Calypogeia fissa]
MEGARGGANGRDGSSGWGERKWVYRRLTGPRLVKTINSKKYGVDQICFAHHPSSWCTRRRTAGMNLYATFLCMTTDTCATSRAIVTG